MDWQVVVCGLSSPVATREKAKAPFTRSEHSQRFSPTATAMAEKHQSSRPDMQISFEDNIAQWSKEVPEAAKRQIPFAASKALNDTAFALKEASGDEIRDSFNNPVLFTQRGLKYRKSNKRMLVATVYFNTDHHSGRKGTSVGKYLNAEIYGGVRRRTRWENYLIRAGIMSPNEYAIPGSGAPRNAAGNVSPGVYARIVAQLRIGTSGIGNESNIKRGRRRKRKTAIFVPQVTGRTVKGSFNPSQQAHRLHRGIWERKSGEIKPLFLFVTDTPDYEKRFDFHYWAGQEASARFPAFFALSFEQAMKTAR